jgi:hypothetical protein
MFRIAFSIASELNFLSDFGTRTTGKSNEDAFKIPGDNNVAAPKILVWLINRRLCIT